MRYIEGGQAGLWAGTPARRQRLGSLSLSPLRFVIAQRERCMGAGASGLADAQVDQACLLWPGADSLRQFPACTAVPKPPPAGSPPVTRSTAGSWHSPRIKKPGQ